MKPRRTFHGKWVALAFILAGWGLYSYFHSIREARETQDQRSESADNPHPAPTPVARSMDSADEERVQADRGVTTAGAGNEIPDGARPDDGEPTGAVPAQAEPEIAPFILELTDPDNPRRKWQAIYELTGPRTPAETVALATYLTDNPIGAAEYLGEEFAHRNFIMDALREQTDARPLVVETFVRMYADPRQGDVLRGYALQHLTSVFIEPLGPPPAAQRALIVSTLRDALSDREAGTLAATALIGLHEIARIDPEAVAAAEVERQALALLADPASGDLTRISALQIAGERRLPLAVEHAERWAADAEADWVVRMAAIYLLRRLSAAEALVMNLTTDGDENVNRAARLALAAWGQ